MSKYSLKISDICDIQYYNTKGDPLYAKIDDLIKCGVEKIFEFDWKYKANMAPMNAVDIDEFYRRFIQHFYMYTIGFDTLPMFQLHLKDKLESVWDYYDNLAYSMGIAEVLTNMNYEQLDNLQRQEKYTGKNLNIAEAMASADTDGETTGSTNSADDSVFFDRPQSRAGNSKDYATTNTVDNGSVNTRDTSKGNTKSESKTSGTTDTSQDNRFTDEGKKQVLGFSGISEAKLVTEWQDHLLRFWDIIFKDFSELFLLTF